MQRPGPLQELPLETFLRPIPPSVKSIRTTIKRPHSPGGPTPFSPVKRRILNAEGIYLAEATCKSPLPSLKETLGSPARFSNVLAGPASPARVLDFGLPKSFSGDPQKRPVSHKLELDAIISPAESSSTTRLAPSPELKAKSVRHTQSLDPMDVTSHNPNSSVSLAPKSLRTSYSTTPRELPPRSTPQSVHYPGFAVYQDPYIITYLLDEANESSSDMEVDNENHKENLPPRRKIRKSVAVASGSLKSGGNVAIASAKKFDANHDTPRSTMRPSTNLSTPPSTKFNRLADKLSLNSMSQDTKRLRRQAMKDELELGEDQNSSDE